MKDILTLKFRTVNDALSQSLRRVEFGKQFVEQINCALLFVRWRQRERG